jgi:hypothetical protein
MVREQGGVGNRVGLMVGQDSGEGDPTGPYHGVTNIRPLPGSRQQGSRRLLMICLHETPKAVRVAGNLSRTMRLADPVSGERER